MKLHSMRVNLLPAKIMELAFLWGLRIIPVSVKMAGLVMSVMTITMIARTSLVSITWNAWIW